MSFHLQDIKDQEDCKAENREIVSRSYGLAEAENRKRYKKGDASATSEYIYDNQKEDATNIVDEYHTNKRRVVSVTKTTKVGADGLMIEVAKQMTTHPDDRFVVDYENVRIITGMSNTRWEKSMKEKAPSCFKDKIFHHGQLRHADLKGLHDALIIVDEIDTGDKEYQVLHNQLNEAGVLDVQYMEEKNIRFLFISATMIKELHELYRWGSIHTLYKMTIPASYVGHMDLLEKGIIQEFYPLNNAANANRWVREDILENYGSDFRVHIVRATTKTIGFIQTACLNNGIVCLNHTSCDRINEETLREIFEAPLKRHTVLVVKGFFRRADYIPNQWKLRTGATHELYTSVVDNSVQIQGLPGRYTGYWRDILEGGHKTGPYRTSIKAVRQYDAIFNDPFGKHPYQTAGFKKTTTGAVKTTANIFVAPTHINGLVPCGGSNVSKSEEREQTMMFIVGSMEEFDTLEEANKFCKKIKKDSRMEKPDSFKNEQGEFVCTTTKTKKVFTYEEFMYEANSWNSASLLNLKDLKSGKVSKVIKPVYLGDKVVWIVRWAIDVKKTDSIERPDVDDVVLAEAIRAKNYEIKCLSPQHFQIKINAV